MNEMQRDVSRNPAQTFPAVRKLVSVTDRLIKKAVNFQFLKNVETLVLKIAAPTVGNILLFLAVQPIMLNYV